MSYNGQTHAGEIMQGAWHVGGAIYRTSSAAAGPGGSQLTQTGVVSTRGQPVAQNANRQLADRLPYSEAIFREHNHDRDKR